MADNGKKSLAEGRQSEQGVKRKSRWGDETPPEKKKVGISLSSNVAAPKSKISFGTMKVNTQSPGLAPIKMALGNSVKTKEVPKTVKPKSNSVAAAFNQDDDSEEEEMPPEAKMRMRNLGRETPTAAGPNSFGKGRLGFCDRQKIIQKTLLEQAEAIQDK